MPQGSILGPLLFLIYINDLAKSHSIAKYLLFADDTAIFSYGKDICALINSLNEELVQVTHWLLANKLTVNIKKTHYIIFHRYKKFTYPLPPIKINQEIVAESKTCKFLGIIIQQQLLWHNHINHLKFKIAKQCGIMYMIRNSIDQQSLLLVYYSLIYPTIIYCLPVWGGASHEALKPLVTIQKRAVRTIGGLRVRDHTSSTFNDLKLLKLYDIITFFTAVFVYKSLHGHLEYGNDFSPNPNNPYRTRNHTDLQPDRVTSAQSQTHVNYRGTLVFNNIPVEIKRKQTLYTFKSSLKKYLLSTSTA